MQWKCSGGKKNYKAESPVGSRHVRESSFMERIGEQHHKDQRLLNKSN